MSAPPSAGLGLCLPSTHYALLLRWHLGEPLVVDATAGRPCGACGAPVDVFGDHAVSCGKVGFGPRHRGIQDFLCRMLARAHLPHAREAHVLGDARRPADVLLRGWEAGRDMAVDITVVHLCPPSLGRLEAGTATRLAAHAEARKVSESETLCAAAGYDFAPFVVDTWGGLHGTAKGLWRDLAARATGSLPTALRGPELGLLRQGLAVALARAVAAQLDHLLEVPAEVPGHWAHLPTTLPVADEAGREVAP